MEETFSVPMIKSLLATAAQVRKLTNLTGPKFSFIIDGLAEDKRIQLTLVYRHNCYNDIKPLVDEILKGE